ncbi:MAG TPA: glycosyltransferase family 9 protein, partial [Phycisphaerae bacterium]|nr:glycosyltransferase family 9 protein [Phycisphaerae bacterium]
FRASDADTASVRRTLRELLGKDDVTPLILLNANCSDLLPLRKWPQERYLELARRLLRQYPELNIAFTGAPSEAGPVAELARSVGSDRCVNMAGRTSMSELMALYNLAEVLITNDSGPAHFASLTGIDVVTLFGPETPAAFGVRSPRSHILWAGLACSPCVNAYNNRLSACRNNLCMQQITVDQVFRTVCEAYESRRAHVAVT